MYKTMATTLTDKGRPFADVEKIDLVTDFAKIKTKLRALEQMYDIVFLDFPGSLNLHKNTLALLTVLDKVFIPFYVDENSFDSTYPFARSLYDFKRAGKTKADIYVFFNKYHDKGKNASEFNRVGDFLKDKGMNMMKHNVYEDVAIRKNIIL